MNKIIPLILVMLILSSCGKKDETTVESVLESKDLKSIRLKKSEMVVQQNEIKEQIKRLDIAISELDDQRKVPLITTFIVQEAVFNHYLEIQGNVTTKERARRG